MRRGTAVLLGQLAAVLVLLGVWELAARFWVDRMFLSPPSAVLGGLPVLFAKPGVAPAFLLLLSEVAVAFVCSVVIGTVLGLLVGAGDVSRRAFMPIVLLLYGTPQITILPIVMLLTGVGAASKVVFGVTHGTFPILITVVAAMSDLRPVLRVSAQSMGASRWQRFRHVLLPHMLPAFFTGVRLAMIACMLGVLLAELFASTAGIGFFTRQFTDAFDPTSLFGVVLVAAAIAIVLNEAMRRAERHFTGWRRVVEG